MELRRLRRRIAAADDPQLLEKEIQVYAHRSLGLHPNSSLRSIGEALASAFPRLDGAALQRLLDDLDAHLYGGTATPLELDRWIARFDRLVRGLGLVRTQGTQDKPALPALNPGAR